MPNTNLLLDVIDNYTRTLTLVPAADQNGQATVSISVQDGTGADQVFFTLDVLPVNDPPQISDIADQVIDEDETLGPLGLTVADIDVDLAADPNALTVTAVSSNPAQVPNENITLGGSGANRTLSLNPTPDQSGFTTIAVCVQDNPPGSENPETACDDFALTVSSFNDPPALTSFAGVVDTTLEDTEVEITFAEMAARGDEVDVDGTVDAFVVRSVTTGTLKIGANAGSATPFAAGTKDTIDPSNNAYWVPAANANGTLDAFAVSAVDNDGAESTGSVTTRVAVLAEYIVNVNSTNGGSTDRVGANTVYHGNTLTITASRWTGYHFSGWSGDAYGTRNPLSIIVTADMTISADFIANGPPTLSSFSGALDTTPEDTEE